jgi:multiphosphoryl transfer protein
VGGDKAVPYLPIPKEENPALGLRGIRVGLWKPEILRDQLRAILKVEPAGQCKIMLPMVASAHELMQVKKIVDELVRELDRSSSIAIGVMVETPAAAATADLLAKDADFLSIGTNDLTQYTLAMDRESPQLAAQVDSLHPAVLRLIHQTCRGAEVHKKWVGVCGGMASDPIAVPILVGLGVRELSCVPPAIPVIKSIVRQLAIPRCRDFAYSVLELRSPSEVRAAATEFSKTLADEHRVSEGALR